MTDRLAAYRHAAKSIAQRLWFASVRPGLTHELGERVFRWTGRRGAAPPPDLSGVQRVLVVRPDKIGDLVLSSSFLRELRRNLPHARIVLVISPTSHSFAASCPYVDEVRCYDWRAARLLGPLHTLHSLAMAARQLWPERFDLAIAPVWGVDHYLASVLAYFSGAPRRIGYSERVLPEKRRLNRGFDRFLTEALDERSAKHQVEHNLDLLRHLGAEVQREELELWTSPQDEEFAAAMLCRFGVRAGEPVVALAPGAGAPKRQWPVERFRALATWLQETHGARIVVLGGPGEEELGRELVRGLGAPVLDLIGRATLLQTGAVLRKCRLFVGNDSGPMHLAAAAGTQVVVIFWHPQNGLVQHAASPVRFGPWGRGHTVLQPATAAPPCSAGCTAAEAHCILGVSVEEVTHAVAAALSHSAELRKVVAGT
jgi:heptosyltransferase-2